jgi:hypothetical protein
LRYYHARNCSVIFGTLTISGINGITERELWDAFSTVTAIRGDLVIEDSAAITTLLPFLRLERVNHIKLQNNPQLVDARLPSLLSSRTVDVRGSPFLCPARTPRTRDQPQGDHSQCNKLELVQLFSIESPHPTSAFKDSILSFFTEQGIPASQVCRIRVVGFALHLQDCCGKCRGCVFLPECALSLAHSAA